MHLYEERVLQLAQEFLKDKSYEGPVLGNPYFVPHASTTSREPIDYWVVPFEHTIFDAEGAFICLDDKTEHIMYVLTAHGYDYVDKKIGTQSRIRKRESEL